MMCTEIDKLEGRINEMKKNLIQISKETSLRPNTSEAATNRNKELESCRTLYFIRSLPNWL